jgi:hypothetical protein
VVDPGALETFEFGNTRRVLVSRPTPEMRRQPIILYT